jgi:hypothetical protein
MGSKALCHQAGLRLEVIRLDCDLHVGEQHRPNIKQCRGWEPENLEVFEQLGRAALQRL